MPAHKRNPGTPITSSPVTGIRQSPVTAISSPLSGVALSPLAQITTMRDLAGPLVRMQELGRTLGTIPNLARSLGALDWHQRWTKPLEDFRQQMEERYRRSLPSNWTRFDLDELLAAIALAGNRGISVVWVPRRSIVLELLTSRGRWGYRKVLLDNSEAILEDIEACVRRRPAFDPTAKRMTLAAVDALRDGHLEAAQTLNGRDDHLHR